jgi:uncharacterized protein YoxC
VTWTTIEPRRLGTGLLAFGLAGAVLAGVAAIALLVGAVGTANLDSRLQDDQVRLAKALGRLTTTVDALATSTSNASATLETTQQTISDSGLVLDQLAVASDALADSLNVSILGNQPFAGGSARLRELAVRVRTLKDDIDNLATKVGTNAADVQGLSQRLADVHGDLDELTTQVRGYDSLDDVTRPLVLGILLAALLVAWIAVGAAVLAWAGWRIRATAPQPDEAAGI